MTDNHLSSSIKLKPRLLKIAELIPPCDCLADIGTDHAYIPIYCLLNGICYDAIASDIKAGPLLRAKENAQNFGVLQKVSLRQGEGLKTLKPGDCDVIVIAGMGGILISQILENSPEIVMSAKHIILQPMTAVLELRQYISRKSFTLSGEYLAFEDDKLYNIIHLKPGGETKYSPKELLVGKDLFKTSPNLYPAYCNQVRKKLEKRLFGLSSSKLQENQQKAQEITQLLSLLDK